jgi:hypothetical protein
MAFSSGESSSHFSKLPGLSASRANRPGRNSHPVAVVTADAGALFFLASFRIGNSLPMSDFSQQILTDERDSLCHHSQNKSN